jgi:hypothetical protein
MQRSRNRADCVNRHARAAFAEVDGTIQLQLHYEADRQMEIV